MGNWITTPLKTGAISQDNYNCTISGLTPSSVYEYRAYMVVDGTPYCGETLYSITCSDIAIPLSVTTGCAYDITSSTMRICDSVVTHTGATQVIEYGVLYTQNGAYGTAASLIHSNYPSHVCKSTICNAISEGQDFFIGSLNEISGLTPNVMTYYRAIATNGSSNGYQGVIYANGVVKSSGTLPYTPIPIDICMNRIQSYSVNSSEGSIIFDPSIPVSESIELTMNIEQESTTGNPTTTEICYGGGALIYCCTTPSGVTVNENVNICMNYGDTICWTHITCGGSGSYADLSITSIYNHSFGVAPTININNYCDRVFESS